MAAFIVGWFIRGRGSSVATVTILPPGHVIQAMPGPTLDRFIPARWGWLWKLRYAVFGKPATVEVEHTFFQFSSDAEGVALRTLKTLPVLVSSNGLSGWVIELPGATVLKDRLNQQPGAVSRVGRVTLGAGVVATLSSSTGPAVSGMPVSPGMSSTYAVRTRGNGVEISGAFVAWDVMTNAASGMVRDLPVFALATNLAMAASMFVPEGKAVFLHADRASDVSQSSAGVLLIPQVK